MRSGSPGGSADRSAPCARWLADLRHVAAASGVRLEIAGASVPCVENASLEEALASGEEYEIALTAPATLDVAAFVRAFDVPLTRIGRVDRVVDDAPGVSLRVAGGAKRVDLPGGYDHFSS